jgi:hypothetical protein
VTFDEVRKWGQPARDPNQTWPSEPGISFSPYQPSAAEVGETAPPFKRLAALFSGVPAQVGPAPADVGQ